MGGRDQAHASQVLGLLRVAADGKRQYQVSTGSGDLADYWPTVEQLADGMLIVSMVDGEPAEPA